MATTEEECLDALRAAAETLEGSPTKAQYEALGATPSASTILRVVGGWNEAKGRAGLETDPSTGSRVASKPDGVSIPDGEAWESLTQDQRWHYRNIDRNTEQSLQRRARLREWVNARKSETGCVGCGESDPACLDFHHRDGPDKEMAITDLITHGHGKESLQAEMAKCEVCCANCHGKYHDNRPAVIERGGEPRTKRERLQRWTYELRGERGCSRCAETDPVCLEFHHRNAEEKTASVSALIADSADAERVRTEVTRCVVLCANCHRREHVDASTGD